MKLLGGWSRVTFLGLLVLSLGLTLILTRSGNAQPQKVLRVGVAAAREYQGQPEAQDEEPQESDPRPTDQ